MRIEMHESGMRALSDGIDKSSMQSACCEVTSPLVTIVTPAYNQAEFVRETISSVLGQSYPNIEYIVIDDGSSDGTADAISEFSGRLVAERQQNMGQAATLNKGWSRAKGKYIGYLSSDDVLYVDAIRKLVEVLERDEGVVCVFPDCDLIDLRSEVVKRNVCRPFVLDDLVVQQECYIGPGALFRRSALEAVGGWRTDMKLAPDREFWIRLASQGRFEFLRETLAGYRIHPRSISYKEVSENVSREYVNVLERYFSGQMGQPAQGVLARRDEAFARAKLVIARNCIRSGALSRGFALYSEACREYPPLRSWRTRISLVRNVISKPVRVAASRLAAIFR